MKINPKQLEKAMRYMGIKTENIEAEEVIIKAADKEIVITNPQIAKVNMGGQATFQISGEISEREKERFSKEDIRMIMEKTGCSEDEARQALEDTGDIAEAILRLKGRKGSNIEKLV